MLNNDYINNTCSLTPENYLLRYRPSQYILDKMYAGRTRHTAGRGLRSPV